MHLESFAPRVSFIFLAYFYAHVYNDLEKPQVKKDHILLASPKIIINFSTGDAEIGILFYNAFLSLRQEEVSFGNGNKITIKNVLLVEQKKATEGQAMVKTLSPIVCRDHNRDDYSNWFYTFEEPEFEPILKRNMKEHLTKKYGDQVQYDIDRLIVEPQYMKKAVVFCHGIYIASSSGYLRLEGEAYLINHFIESGLGSLTGSGFGMLERT
ncbi:CRISPR-associated endoribonuclease Cas6 [Listeria ilorinensis]|uniref:CRISPR-associated endoribonuclease Cas6 n=1 Tax=Listeria ilorinensis TaxID=2867439 RepID=UPI001EF71794|nr:CRISPR-associated endoribonuclease Cas6 [Listeria ilorinensis]